MAINNITQTISTIPPAGARGVDVQTQFVIKQEDFQDHLQGITVDELNTLKDQLNSRIGEINSTATTMNGYADTASAGASTATTKAGEASTSASGALTSKNQASTFATNSSNSATKASQWADNNYNVEVETGKYSAKHWSTVAQNATANKVDKVTSTDNAVVRFNGTTGEVQNSAITIDDVGTITVTSPENSAIIGVELLSNGTFTGSASGWTLGTNWAYSSNTVVCTLNASAEGTLSQNVSVVLDNYYLLEWYQTNSIDTNGQITPALGSVVGGKHSSGTTTQMYQQIFRATSTGSVSLSFAVTDITSTGIITIDSVSLKQITPMNPSISLPSTIAGERKNEIRSTWNGVSTPNIGIGWRCLQNNTTGYQNTASGGSALLNNTTGYANTANGVSALLNNTTGYNNTASGVSALINNTTGYQNTANGVGALSSSTTFINISGFGYNSQVTGSNQVQLGDAATTTYVYGTVQNRSDIRDKADVRDTILGLDFIKSLRPVDYKWDMREDYKPEKPNIKMPETSDENYEELKAEYDRIIIAWLEACKPENIVRDGSKKRSRYHHGFIAQEVQALDVDFGGLQDHSVKGGHDVLSIGYDEIIAPLVKAVQEQQAMIDLLKAKIEILEEVN